MQTAYLVVHIKPSSDKPVVSSAGIYSESGERLTGCSDWCAATIFSAEGKTYSEARENILETLRGHKRWTWLLDLLKR